MGLTCMLDKTQRHFIIGVVLKMCTKFLTLDQKFCSALQLVLITLEYWALTVDESGNSKYNSCILVITFFCISYFYISHVQFVSVEKLNVTCLIYRSKRWHSKNETTRLEKSKHMSSKSRSRSSSSGASGNRQQR